MQQEAMDELVEALRGARRGERAYWFGWVCEDADGTPMLVVDHRQGLAERHAKAVRKTAKDARWAHGDVELNDGELRFVVRVSSAPLAKVRKTITEKLAKLRPLATARPWLSGAEVVEELQELPEGDGEGIKRREEVEDRSSSTKRGEKKLTEYVQFLESLDGWHRAFGGGVTLENLGEARSRLERVEESANAWLTSHKKGLLESKDNKRRRKEILRVLEQIAAARRRLMLTFDRPTEDDVEGLHEAEVELDGLRVEEEVERQTVWRQVVGQGLEQGRFRLKEGDPLGQGAYGLVRELDGGEGAPPLVAKLPVGERPVELTNARREFERELQHYEQAGIHPNLVRCFGMVELEGKPALVLELAQGGSLAKFIEKKAIYKAGGMTEGDYVAILQHAFRGVARALRHLHLQGFSHNDLKPDNILLDTRTGEAKVADFGTLGMGVRGQHGTAPYGLPPTQGGTGPMGQDGLGLGMSVFEGLTGDITRYEGEQIDERAVFVRVLGEEDGGERWDELTEEERGHWQDFFAQTRHDDLRNGLYRARREAFIARGGHLFEGGEGGPMLAVHDFANQLFHPDRDQRPSPEQLIAMPFISDAVTDEDTGCALVQKLPQWLAAGQQALAQ